jgi:hypothetical protein
LAEDCAEPAKLATKTRGTARKCRENRKKREAHRAWNVLWWVVLHMRTLCFLPALSAIAMATMVSTAHAQTAPMTTVGMALTRLNADGSAAPARPNNSNLNVITFEDCVEDRAYKIVLNTMSVPDPRYTLQGWAGAAECLSNAARRQPANQTCWKAIEDLGQNGTGTVIARVRDIVANDVMQKESYVNVRNADKCASLNKANITLNFMWVQSGPEAGIPATGNPVFTVDTTGPAAPTGLEVSAGETLLVASWDAPKTVADLTGYRLYCEEIPDGATVDDSDASTPIPDAANSVSDASQADAEPNDAATTEDASGAADAAVDAAVGAADAAVGATDAGNVAARDPNCPSKLLIAGAQPSGSLKPCASPQGPIGTQQNITGLKNGARYAIAVAAINRNGNTSPLSNVVCGIPIEVDTFFDQYKQAGGGAVGCSTSNETPSLAALGVVAAVVLSNLRKRRQS